MIKVKIIWLICALVIIAGLLVIHTRPKKITKMPITIKGKIAIVIDDWGYNLNNLHLVEQIKYPLTCSVLPNLNYSSFISEELHKKGLQIILHLPMEPHEKFRLEKDTIMTSMDEPAIGSVISKALESIPNAIGVSNHMGSKATQDARLMEIIFKELKKRRLYFLDSFVSADSICADTAKRMRLGFAKRDIFLDNKEEPAYIKNQIDKLKARAKVYGQAIGIGHDRKITLEVLNEIMPKIKQEGYKFVFVSELLSQQ